VENMLPLSSGYKMERVAVESGVLQNSEFITTRYWLKIHLP
jgi:hypothetical protein